MKISTSDALTPRGFSAETKTCCFCCCFSVRLSGNDGWLRLEGSGIPYGRGQEGSVWKRDSRWVSWRGGRVGAVGSGVGGSGVEGSDGVGLEGLRMLENHFWTAEAGDDSEGVVVDGVVVVVLREPELLRVRFADLVRISPLKLSTARFLSQKNFAQSQYTPLEYVSITYGYL